MQQHGESRERNSELAAWIIGIAVLVGVLMVADWRADSTVIEGTPGLITDIIFRLTIAAFIFLMACSSMRTAIVSRKISIWARLLLIAVSVTVFISAFFLVRNPVKDIAYLKNQSETVINNIDLEHIEGKNADTYILNGSEGESFNISRSSYEEVSESIEKDGKLQAKVSYLPNTKTVMKLEIN